MSEQKGRSQRTGDGQNKGGRGSRPARTGRTRRKSTKSGSNASGAGNQTGMRLQRVLADAGVASRRKAEELIAAGEIRVNGQVVTEMGTRVDPESDRITFRGRTIRAAQKVYFVLNKPDGVVCSAEGAVDDRGRPTVLSLLRGVSQRVYPVGRLDFRTRGVLILTNDGVLASKLTHPSSGVVKTYHVKFQGKLSKAELDLLRDGVRLDDGVLTMPAAELLVIRETAANTWIQLGLRQGLNRQIRRMGEAIDRPVLKILRVAVGEITADGLEEGEFRKLSSTEVAQLLHGELLDEA